MTLVLHGSWLVHEYIGGLGLIYNSHKSSMLSSASFRESLAITSWNSMRQIQLHLEPCCDGHGLEDFIKITSTKYSQTLLQKRDSLLWWLIFDRSRSFTNGPHLWLTCSNTHSSPVWRKDWGQHLRKLISSHIAIRSYVGSDKQMNQTSLKYGGQPCGDLPEQNLVNSRDKLMWPSMSWGRAHSVSKKEVQ